MEKSAGLMGLEGCGAFLEGFGLFNVYKPKCKAHTPVQIFSHIATSNNTTNDELPNKNGQPPGNPSPTTSLQGNNSTDQPPQMDKPNTTKTTLWPANGSTPQPTCFMACWTSSRVNHITGLGPLPHPSPKKRKRATICSQSSNGGGALSPTTPSPPRSDAGADAASDGNRGGKEHDPAKFSLVKPDSVCKSLHTIADTFLDGWVRKEIWQMGWKATQYFLKA
ncbi:hypothetical protein PCANC_24302 [Puccinia coronata f. sp. avenae]|uniref:Uncharacterized protein n=1 Tax=Puccinia coronata f. sp. avenae TaxID=200324 RepID=A0A2N5TUD6_9BASI|nr:hypothetical protein PCANC_24302 [Puccinia coronata f. sp. avenae]